MSKFLKLTGVSMLAIMTAANANAAGYTCEELIEYTSCNTGYTLSAGNCVAIATCSAGTYSKVICPDGYEYSSDWCFNHDDLEWNKISPDECEDNGYRASYVGMGCISDDVVKDYGNANLSQLVPVSYTCVSCPNTGLVSPNNTPILATTASGASSIAECYVPSGVEIKGEHGIYRFKSNCNAFDMATATYEEKVAKCASFGGKWVIYNSKYQCIIEFGVDPSKLTTEEQCVSYVDCWWSDSLEECDCMGSDSWVDLETGEIFEEISNGDI